VSSVSTVNGTAVLTGVVEAGSVVKTTLFAAAGVTVTVAVAVPSVGASVATNAHEPVLAPLRMMLVNVAFPEVAVVVSTRLPANVQFVEDNVMVSPLVAVVKATVKVVPVFAATEAGGFVKVSPAEAEAGSTPTKATPASSMAEPTPAPSTIFALDATPRRFVIRFTVFMRVSSEKGSALSVSAFVTCPLQW
jgi:hypothetical protein